MTAKKYQVFISSTYIDLMEERRNILDILLMADCIPAGMESFVATDDQQFEVIKKVIDLCDYYILLIGKCYGSINPTTELSYTEMEYEYAKKKGVPVLVFAIDDSVELSEDKQENDHIREAKLFRFREKALTNRLASIWKSNEDLAGKIAISIMSAKINIARPGWQRATDFDEVTLRREIMELQEQKSNLETKLFSANKLIASFTNQNNAAFENYEVKISYYYLNYNNHRENNSKKIPLPRIFTTIATEMLDVMITDALVTIAIEEQLLSERCHLNDGQLVKRILTQLKALNLVYSNWDETKNQLFWGLTTKGTKVRDDMVLIKNAEIK